MIARFGPAAEAARFEPFSAAEVARQRGRPPLDVERARSRLSARIDPPPYGGGGDGSRPSRGEIADER